MGVPVPAAPRVVCDEHEFHRIPMAGSTLRHICGPCSEHVWPLPDKRLKLTSDRLEEVLH